MIGGDPENGVGVVSRMSASPFHFNEATMSDTGTDC